MKFSRYNSEGYHDPTPYEAISKIEAERKAQTGFGRRWRPLVYICSPYSDDILNNERKARVFCKFAVQQGVIPIAPHLLYPQFLDDSDPAERELGLFFGIVLLTKCEEIWVFGTHVSAGMAAEIAKAKSREIQIRYFSEDCQEVHGVES